MWAVFMHNLEILTALDCTQKHKILHIKNSSALKSPRVYKKIMLLTHFATRDK